MNGELTKVTVKLIPSSVVALSRATQIEENTRTDTINRALQFYAFMVQRTKIEGWTIHLRNDEGDEEEVTIT